MTASRITYDSLATAGVTAEELAALARQARGGASGGRGYGYEDHFAVSCLIAASVAWFERGEDWVVTLGHACCWVDDVVVERPDAEQYAQLKTSPDETWGAGGWSSAAAVSSPGEGLPGEGGGRVCALDRYPA